MAGYGSRRAYMGVFSSSGSMSRLRRIAIVPRYRNCSCGRQELRGGRAIYLLLLLHLIRQRWEKDYV